MSPHEVDETDDLVFDAMVRRMQREAAAIEAAANRPRR
jgi:hypothetical protein